MMAAEAVFRTLVHKVVEGLSGDTATLDERLQRVVHILAGYFKVEKCSVMIINKDDMTLEVRASTNLSIIGMKRRLSDVTVATRALIEDAPFQADKKRLSYFTPADRSRYSSSNSLSIPIRYDNKKIGVMNLTDTGSHRGLTKRQVKEAAEIIDYLAVYLYASQARNFLVNRTIKYKDAVSQLVSTNEMKANLTSFIVHDLKGPISTIMANLDMLSHEVLNEQQMESVNLALNDVYKMQRMVMNILDVQKMEEGKIKIYRQETDICELAGREIAAFKNLLVMNGTAIVLEGEPRMLYIDESLIGRTISNLLINAIEHSAEGQQITVGIRHDAVMKETVVSIADEGIRIPDDLKEKIFDKYFQLGTGKMYRKTSTGLGLTFCKLAIDAHGGRLWVEDNDKCGTRFIFTLPEKLKRRD
ncbi:MAG: hypothetical protein HQL09_04905 [Nitrospirae bacterium]|nr:hypothetical protein [Nitrospirota bacterium]